jgi:hypothetical protein
MVVENSERAGTISREDDDGRIDFARCSSIGWSSSDQRAPSSHIYPDCIDREYTMTSPPSSDGE